MALPNGVQYTYVLPQRLRAEKQAENGNYRLGAHASGLRQRIKAVASSNLVLLALSCGPVALVE